MFYILVPDCLGMRRTYRVCLPGVGTGGEGLLACRMMCSGAGQMCILHGLMEQCRVVVNNLIQSGDVQGRLLLNASSSSEGGRDRPC